MTTASSTRPFKNPTIVTRPKTGKMPVDSTHQAQPHTRQQASQPTTSSLQKSSSVSQRTQSPRVYNRQQSQLLKENQQRASANSRLSSNSLTSSTSSASSFSTKRISLIVNCPNTSAGGSNNSSISESSGITGGVRRQINVINNRQPRTPAVTSAKFVSDEDKTNKLKNNKLTTRSDKC